MSSSEKQQQDSAEKTVREIRRRTRRRHSSEEKIGIVVDGLRGEDSIAELCRREQINQNLYYRWSKEFLEAGKKRLAGDTAREANSDAVKSLRTEASLLKEMLAEVMMENRLLKKTCWGWGGRYMRYSSSEKLEIIGLVETSGLPVRRTLVQLGIPKATFYDGYRRYLEDGIDGLKDQQPKPVRVWNKVPEETGSAIVGLALQADELSPRELAVRYTDTARYLVSESTVYRLLKARDLITVRHSL